MKRILCLMVTFICVAIMCLAQQMPNLPQLPNDPEVKTGKLDNGMTYYIRHNALPAKRAEFYLATHVGAIQETPDQDGLAHFLEHMCFNGLKNLPGKQMLEYLQHIGAEFGRNINASTGVEVTQYMLNNIPVIREGILDTCLLVMHDYSHFVLNDPKEIDAERGVILEEKRTRNNASWRMFEKELPYLYGDSKYATCTIIGSEDNLKNFKPSSLKSFYETWYQPSNQAIIVVGDIDIEQVYNKIVKLFADIPAPEKPVEKVMPDVPLNKDPMVGILTDKENTQTSISYIWKLGKPLAKELQGTQLGYLNRMVKQMFSQIMYERFQEISTKANAPFTQASAAITNLTETCETIYGSVDFEGGKYEPACNAFLTEMEKVKRFGVTEGEVARCKENILKRLKDNVASASTRKNAEFIRPLINHFFYGFTYATPEQELQNVETIFTQLDVNLLNQILKQALVYDHLAIIYEGVDKEGIKHPSQEELLAFVDGVKKAEIQAPVEEEVNTDLLEGRQIKIGKIKKQTEGKYGAQEWILSNGLKVVLQPTTYQKDQITMSLRAQGGKSLILTEDLPSFEQNVLGSYNGYSGLASFSKTTLKKMLTGKRVSLSPFISGTYHGMDVNSTPEDLETAFQLLYLAYEAPRFDQEEWDASMQYLQSIIPNFIATPNYALVNEYYKTLYNNPRAFIINPELLKKANMQTYEKYYRLFTKDVAGATLYIVGNFKLDSIKPMVEKYCASLKAGKKASKWNPKNILEMQKGSESKVFSTKMATPKVTVLQNYTADIPYSIQKETNLDAANFILDMIYTETLREQEGGTYGASASISLEDEPKEKANIQVQFDTNVKQQETLRKLAIKGLKDLAENGPTQEQLTRAIENAKKNLPEKRISNSYWMQAQKFNAFHHGDYDKEYEQAINNISADGIRSALQEILKQNNLREVIMLPEEK